MKMVLHLHKIYSSFTIFYLGVRCCVGLVLVKNIHNLLEFSNCLLRISFWGGDVG